METKAWPSEAVTPHGGTDLAKTWRSAEGLPWGWLDVMQTWWIFMDVTCWSVGSKHSKNRLSEILIGVSEGIEFQR
jgi:hypothetical protein